MTVRTSPAAMRKPSSPPHETYSSASDFYGDIKARTGPQVVTR